MSRCRHMTRITFLGLLAAAGAFTMTMTTITSAQELPYSERAFRESPYYEAMIEGLVSRNAPPEMVRIKVGAAKLPLFPADYDWEEQARILTLSGHLTTNDDPRLWEHYLRHMDDKRYAVTVGTEPGHYAENYSVGDICYEAAWARLDFAMVHLKQIPGEQHDVIRLDLGNTVLTKWRKERATKRLYELQIELCETALEKVAVEDGLSQEAKERISKELREKKSLLVKTKEPRFAFATWDGYDKYNAKMAQEIRERFEREKSDKNKEN